MAGDPQHESGTVLFRLLVELNSRGNYFCLSRKMPFFFQILAVPRFFFRVVRGPLAYPTHWLQLSAFATFTFRTLHKTTSGPCCNSRAGKGKHLRCATMRTISRRQTLKCFCSTLRTSARRMDGGEYRGCQTRRYGRDPEKEALAVCEKRSPLAEHLATTIRLFQGTYRCSPSPPAPSTFKFFLRGASVAAPFAEMASTCGRTNLRAFPYPEVSTPLFFMGATGRAVSSLN